MITQPTVFVLGAGASRHLDFPCGKELKLKILEEIKAPGSLLRTSLRDSDMDEDQIDLFAKSLERSPVPSIDWFLQNQTQFAPIGKVAITAILRPIENLESLFDGRRAENWYNFLFEQMSRNCKFEDFPNNQVSFITFNYDRSLEAFIIEALKHSYGRKYDEVFGVYQRLKIIHMHGSFGAFPLNCEPTYGMTLGSSASGLVRAMARTLKIIHDELNQENLTLAQDLIKNAFRVLFLGFGFHEMNMGRLYPGPQRDARLMGMSNNRWGTARGLSKVEKSSINSQFGVDLFDTDCETFLRDEINLT